MPERIAQKSVVAFRIVAAAPWMLLALWTACSTAGGTADRGGAARQPDGGAGADAGIVNLEASIPDAGGQLDSGDEGDELPEPWQYYAVGDELAYRDDALPDDVKDRFAGPVDATALPEIEYPLADSMHPLNLGDVTFQWTRGTSESSLFRITVTGGGKTFRFYVPCGHAGEVDAGESPSSFHCSYTLPESEWLDVAERNKGGEVSVVISGTSDTGGAVRTSLSRRIFFSPEAVRGGLYYWSTEHASIKRATFGAKKAVHFVPPNSRVNEFECAACHSVSRDGKVMAFAVSKDVGGTRFAIQYSSTESPEAPYVRPNKGADGVPTNHFGDNVALNPDGSMSVVNGADDSGMYLELRDPKTGATVGRRYRLQDPVFGPSGNNDVIGILPEWSPDGRAVAVTLARGDYGGGEGSILWTADTSYSDIGVMPYDPLTRELGTVQILVAAANRDDWFHYYPSWSPDGKWIVFVSAPSHNNHTNPNGILRVVASSGGPWACPGSQCYELERGTQYSLAEAALGRGKASSWPKFAPFGQKDSSLFFVSFSSGIDYGHLARGGTQLWLFAVDVARLGREDASFAPVWLPYQDYTDGSRTPYWTEVLACNLDPNGGCQGCVGDERCVVDRNNRCECRTIIR
jgi:hypothetical protein